MNYDLEGVCQDCMYLEKIKPCGNIMVQLMDISSMC